MTDALQNIRQDDAQPGLVVSAREWDDTDLVSLAGDIYRNQTMVTLQRTGGDWNERARKSLTWAILHSDNRNLVLAPGISPEVDAFCKENKNFAATLYRKICNNPSSLTCEELYEVPRRAGAIQHLARNDLNLTAKQREALADCIIRETDALIAALPPLPAGANIRFADLVTPNAAGITPLDNPRVWEHFGGIARRLCMQSDPVRKSDLMQKNRHGQTYLEAGIGCQALRPILAELNRNEEILATRDLLGPENQPGRILQTAIRQRQIPAIFTPANWHGQNPADLKKLFAAMPIQAQAQVNNYHTLFAALNRGQDLRTAKSALSI